jgi:HlyD family secretion protein
VEQARTALDVAELRLERSELMAPFDGVVAVVNAKAGELASNLTPAVVLLDPGQFHLDVTVDEVDVAQLSIGQAVTITVDALPGLSLSGRVDRLAPTGTIVGGVVNYAARLTLDSTDASLRAGMSATAEVVVAEVRDVVLVPNWAIRRDRRTGQAYASLKVGDGLIEAPIETGLRGEAYTEVLGGVKEGDVAAVSTEREGIDLFGGG